MLSTGTIVPLPIDPLIPGIIERLKSSSNLVIEAPPGAGKTTRVPPALLGAFDGEIIVLEPRRLAARMAARRVASEMGERVGETTGYHVRFEEVAGPRTRLRFMTEGVLTRRLLSDTRLQSVSAVVLDEFHERHLEGDLALALLKRLQETSRPELRIVVMSATLNAAPVARFLNDCPAVRSEGRQFEISVSYVPSSPESLEQQVASALGRLLEDGAEGDVLVFLPGAAEIRRAARACEPIARRFDLLVLPLYGDLSPEEQERAVSPAPKRKVILSTNVAESSITIEGVTAVIDSGLARVASQSPWSGLPKLTVARVSKASANQRAGRAGRLGPGRVIRLYPAEDFHRRLEHDLPEIARAELSQLVLTLASLGIADPATLHWMDAPPEQNFGAARDLLRRLGALDEGGRLTPTGREMARMPLHPRLARLVIEAGERGVADAGCGIAALLSAGERLPEAAPRGADSDLLVLLESEWGYPARRIYQQIRGLARNRSKRGTDDDLLISVLAAFPDRVARRRQGNELLLSNGGSAVLSPSSVVHSGFLVCVDIEERRERGLPLVRLANGIRPEWLLDLFPEHVSERTSLEWNRAAERIEEISAMLYDELVIEQSIRPPGDMEAASGLLYQRAADAGVGRFADREELNLFLARAAFASEHCGLESIGEQLVQDALRLLCQGKRSFAELEADARGGGLLRALESLLDRDQLRRLNECAPARIRLPGGRQVKVNYAAGQTPWIASRLQDFFGMADTPRVAGGKVPLVVHLLAPNHRPVQMTTDLAGFWQRLYPQVRRELSRRYPKHAWPERPGV